MPVDVTTLTISAPNNGLYMKRVQEYSGLWQRLQSIVLSSSVQSSRTFKSFYAGPADSSSTDWCPR